MAARKAGLFVAVKINPCLSVLPGDLRLHQFDENFWSHSKRDKQLKYLFLLSLPQPDPFDFVLIDCPPNLGLLTLNALEVAQEVIIPLEPSFFSLHGLAKISETLQRVGSERGRPHRINALVTRYEKENDFAQEVYEEVRKHFGERLFHSVIHEDGVLREAAGAGLSIADFDTNSSGYRDYMSLATEILERGWQWEVSVRSERRKNNLKYALGPQRVFGGILFQFRAPEAKKVLVAGDFNQWVGESLLRRTQTGVWQKVVPLRKGGYRYKFLVDGEWRLDPAAPQEKENPYGNRDSYVEIDGAS
jgi:cellulose biosynthesis protein BcsQ